MHKFLPLIVGAAAFAAPVFSQDVPKLRLQVGGGATVPTQQFANRVNTGWNVTANGGYRFPSGLSLGLDFQYHGFGLNNDTLRSLEVPDGNVQMWSLSFNPQMEFNPAGKVSPYVTGGFGLYSRTVQFTRPSAAPRTFCDFYFGFCYDALVPVNQILNEYTDRRGGWNIGAGLAFKFREGHRERIFVEARYSKINLRGRDTEIIPITAGLRW